MKASKVVIAVGVAMLVSAIVRYVTAPPELAFGAPGWFESAKDHGDATSVAAALAMFSFFVIFVGIVTLPSVRDRMIRFRGRQIRALAESAAVGFRDGSQDPKARLARLKEMHEAGDLTDAEYTRKRAEIVDQL